MQNEDLKSGPASSQNAELDPRAMKQEPSFGMQLVGISFNPSGDEKVNRLKMLAAEMADIVNDAQPANGEKPSYLFNLVKGNALREILNAQMNAVKLVTLKY